MTDSIQKLLIVEDDPGLQRQFKWCFENYEVITAGDRASAIAELRRHEPAVVLQDLGLPPDPDGVSEGFETLREILKLAPHTKVIVVTGNGDNDSAVKAVGLGACDFCQKPVETEILALIVDRARRMYELEFQNRILNQRHGAAPLKGIIATSEQMLAICRQVEKLAPTSATVLLLGESGTGKELLARAIHSLSPRGEQNFVAINCAAIPDNLLESELFGYERGAFTGAVKQTPGKFELADGGTLFLDEIGDLSPALQAKLLRFLQERIVERVGGREPIPVDVRIVCATNQDLSLLIEGARFREDLYYRVAEVTVDIPPLRERDGDAVVLARALLEKQVRHHGRSVRGFTNDAIACIESYPWPGNIRELENRINGAVIMADGKQVTADDLGLEANGETTEFINLRTARQQADRTTVKKALALSEGNMSKAAELLGVTRPTLYDLINKHGIRSEQ